jgi:hypothetical protein
MYATDKIRNLGVDELRILVDESRSKKEILEKLDINPANGNAKSVLSLRLRENGLKSPRGFSNWNKYSKEQLLDAVKKAKCMTDVINLLGLSVNGGNRPTLKKLIKELGLDTSHFDITSRRNRGKNLTKEEIFVENKHVPKISKFILKFGLLDYRCGKCGNTGEWLGEELKLQPDHINGNNRDNRIENLRYLCPNCHTQTETYAGRNKKK